LAGTEPGLSSEEEVLVIRACPACGTQNRVRVGRLADEARCGKCKSPLPPIADPIEVDPSLFDEVVREASVPVLVDFWAGWCAPCRIAAPEVQRAASALAGRALVLKVDTEAHPELAQRYGVRGIPNFVVLKDGQVVLQQAGVVRSDQMVEWLKQAGA
jgi:thioredoxin 2